jgi:glucose-6-phosphate 1-dehydrogenase
MEAHPTASLCDRDGRGPDGLREHAVASPGVLVILGASGDLTKRLLLPAIYNLACDGLLPEEFAVVGMARRDLDTAAFRSQQREEIGKFHTRRSFDAARWDWLESRLHYTSGDFGDRVAYDRLREAVDRATAAHGAGGNTLFYLAISPDLFATVNRMLDEAGLTRMTGARRIIVEKPFGKDLDSAMALNRDLLSRWREEEIYRIDHYLGKETVQNLLAFRLANPMFEPLWNATHVDHVQISAAETVGVETRGDYYDGAGVVRDMLQNHLMQILSYVCMELPASIDPSAIREAKSRLLDTVRVPSAADVAVDCVRGQYGAGRKADGSPACGYREEPKVAQASITPTYAAIKLHIDNDRWRGTPVYLRSGKALWKRGTEVVVQFRRGPDGGEPNLLIFHIQPQQGVEIRLRAKRPGPTFQFQRAGMRFDYADTFEASRGTGYEVLLYAALNGDPTLFSRTDFVERSWRIVQPVLDAWRNSSGVELPNYAAGTWGPRAAHDLLARDGRRWHECLTRDVLLRSELFADAPPLLVNSLALAFEPRAVGAGDVVVERGERSGDVYVVCLGDLVVEGEGGRPLGTLHGGDCFGEMAALHDTARTATVRAVSPCDLLVLSQSDFLRIIHDFPRAEEAFRRLAASRIDGSASR